MDHKCVLAVALAALAGVTLAAPGAEAKSLPVLDGKKVTKLTFSASGGLQDNDQDLATSSNDRADCAAPRCAALTFVYKPAKGVRGDTAYEISWTIPSSDVDLYVAEVVHGSRTTIATCGAVAGTSEKVFVPAGTLRAGRTYALVADFYRSFNDTVTGTVTMPGANSVATTVPAAADSAVAPINCGT
jgi:hypothetical protein